MCIRDSHHILTDGQQLHSPDMEDQIAAGQDHDSIGRGQLIALEQSAAERRNIGHLHDFYTVNSLSGKTFKATEA